jgi:SAM-dependent methyltransferase
MIDGEYRHPRLAAVYDALDPDRGDLDAYVEVAEELGAERVLDVGCGTGTFALLLAGRGLDVIAVDPAAASLAVARGKPGAQRVRWIEGDATAVSVRDRDLTFMTANAAQAIADPRAWEATLRAIGAALRAEGVLVFETRDPAARAWERWNRETTQRSTSLPGGESVTSWVQVLRIDWPLVSFRWTWIFDSDGETLTSESTLRFRERDEIEADLRRTGYVVLDVRDAPDRPGEEFVFVCRRSDGAGGS